MECTIKMVSKAFQLVERKPRRRFECENSSRSIKPFFVDTFCCFSLKIPRPFIVAAFFYTTQCECLSSLFISFLFIRRDIKCLFIPFSLAWARDCWVGKVLPQLRFYFPFAFLRNYFHSYDIPFSSLPIQSLGGFASLPFSFFNRISHSLSRSKSTHTSFTRNFQSSS